ncbi:hypothetical protein ACFLTU_10765, partial [Bacteroidota bacterium]
MPTSNRVVTVTGVNGKTVTLVNLTIQHGYAKDTVGDGPGLDNGGGMLVDNQLGGILIAENCVFQNNMAVGKGGGVYSSGVNTFMNCSFTDNSNSDADQGDGGGAYGNWGTVFEGSTFTGNSAGDQGGGCYIDTLTLINDCVFEDNYATDDGGGAKLQDSTSVCTNSTFTDNDALDNGGALYVYGGRVENCHFEADSCGDDGGAVMLDNGGFISNCTFTLNYSVDKGGGLNIASGTATDVEVYNNTGGDHGGGVYVNNDGVLKNSTISNNYAGDDGGGIMIDDPSGIVDNCIITGNESFDHGGGVFNDDGTLKNSTITGNLCGNDGGGVAVDEILGLGENCVISGNESVDHAGGVMIQAGRVVNCVIDGNHSGDDGGGVRGNGTWMVTNSILYGNTSTVNDENNVSVNTNTKAVSVNYCALDSVGHGLTTEIANSIQLDASPFVGGTGSDSLLLLPGSAPIDAGTLTDSVYLWVVSDLLPENDIDGNPRVAHSVVDL